VGVQVPSCRSVAEIGIAQEVRERLRQATISKDLLNDQPGLHFASLCVQVQRIAGGYRQALGWLVKRGAVDVSLPQQVVFVDSLCPMVCVEDG
ncbi:hypothetical protein, partial [Rhizobium sp. Rhizsp42]|uniref:hypothetical protein n=1 Tax=Rhizobium sp. Rhizsp42 TaxID=3243034 RepID=UPI0039B06E8E